MAAVMRLDRRPSIPAGCAARSPPSRSSTSSPSGRAPRSSSRPTARTSTAAFPGDPAGAYTQRPGARDLHRLHRRRPTTCSTCTPATCPEALEPFCLYEESPVEDRARALALAYGPGTWSGRAGRRARSGAAPAARPPTPASPRSSPRSAPTGSATRPPSPGTCRACSTSAPPWACSRRGRTLPVGPPAEYDGWIWMRSAVRGFWQSRVGGRCRTSRAGDLLGVLLDPSGSELDRVVAPAAGCPLFLTTSPAVAGRRPPARPRHAPDPGPDDPVRGAQPLRGPLRRVGTRVPNVTSRETLPRTVMNATVGWTRSTGCSDPATSVAGSSRSAPPARPSGPNDEASMTRSTRVRFAGIAAVAAVALDRLRRRRRQLERVRQQRVAGRTAARSRSRGRRTSSRWTRPRRSTTTRST